LIFLNMAFESDFYQGKSRERKEFNVKQLRIIFEEIVNLKRKQFLKEFFIVKPFLWKSHYLIAPNFVGKENLMPNS